LYSIIEAGITKNIKANAFTAGCQTDKTVQIAVMIAMPALNLFLKWRQTILFFSGLFPSDAYLSPLRNFGKKALGLNIENAAEQTHNIATSSNN